MFENAERPLAEKVQLVELAQKIEDTLDLQQPVETLRQHGRLQKAEAEKLLSELDSAQPSARELLTNLVEHANIDPVVSKALGGRWYDLNSRWI